MKRVSRASPSLARGSAFLVLALLTLGAQAPNALAEDYADGWGLPEGAKTSALEAPDQTGALRNLGSLAGERGLLLFVNRSADW